MSEPRVARASGLAVAFAIDLALAVALALGAFMACGIVWAATHDAGHAANGAQRAAMPGPLAEVLSVIAAMGSAAAGLLWWRRRPSREEWRESFAAARRPATWGVAMLAALGVTLLAAALGAVASASGLQLDPSNDAIIRTLLQRHPALLWGFVAVLAPLYEEVLFRRVVFGRFAQAGFPRAGLAISAALFACVHELPGAGEGGLAAGLVLWSVYALMGVAFALVYRRCGTLWAAILAHAAYNAIGLLMLLR